MQYYSVFNIFQTNITLSESLIYQCNATLSIPLHILLCILGGKLHADYNIYKCTSRFASKQLPTILFSDE